MRKEVKELLKAIEDNTIEAEIYKDEVDGVYSIVPLQYIADELEQLKGI